MSNSGDLEVINCHLHPETAADQHGFRSGHAITSALLQLTSDIEGNRHIEQSAWIMFSLLISAPKSSVTLFTPDPMQVNTNLKIKIDDSELPLVRSRRRKQQQQGVDTGHLVTASGNPQSLVMCILDVSIVCVAYVCAPNRCTIVDD